MINKPTGVRFDVAKTDLVMKREKLETKQQVLHFLLDEYWEKHGPKTSSTVKSSEKAPAKAKPAPKKKAEDKAAVKESPIIAKKGSSVELAALRMELATLTGTSALAKARKKFVENRIKQLEKQ